MNRTEFADYMAERFRELSNLYTRKADEYVGDEPSAFHNFKQAADLQRCTPEQSLLGFLTKHLVSMVDIVHGTAKGGVPSKGMVQEKCGDIILYVAMLEGMLIERGETGNVLSDPGTSVCEMPKRAVGPCDHEFNAGLCIKCGHIDPNVDCPTCHG